MDNDNNLDDQILDIACDCVDVLQAAVDKAIKARLRHAPNGELSQAFFRPEESEFSLAERIDHYIRAQLSLAKATQDAA